MFRKAVIGLLIASFSLGSFPAGVGAYQVSRTREKLSSAFSSYTLAQRDMAAMLERANTPVSAGTEAHASTPSLTSEFEFWGGGFSI